MSTELKIGDIVLGCYQIKDILGRGGEGTAYKVIDKNMGHSMVIKQLDPTLKGSAYDQAVLRFKRAGKARFNHPNVVDPVECSQDNGHWLMVMPFIEGKQLDKYVKQNGNVLSIDKAVSILKQIASGVGTIHSGGYVHRDIKPENIIVSDTGKVSIIDLGICSNIYENTITDAAGMLGTIAYMSPEQAIDATKANHLSDIYSLGAVFYFMLTGRLTVEGRKIKEIIENICNVTAPAPSSFNNSVPPDIDNICMKMLAKSPTDRFQSADEVICTLDSGSSNFNSIKAGRFCSSCGNSLYENARFCHKCGAGFGQTIETAVRCFACGNLTGESDICPSCNRQFSSSDHRLTFTCGTLTGSLFRIPEGNYYVGRNELSGRDFTISRRHLSVYCVNGTVYVEDAGSANHTFVAGQIANRRTPLLENCQLAIAGNTAIYSNCN